MTTAIESDGNSGLTENRCELLDLPNWAYSYGLTLYKLHLSTEDQEQSESLLQRANEALKNAVNRYPSIPQLLLEKNKVDVRGRSCNVDWPTVMVKLFRRTTTYNEKNNLTDLESANHIIQIFVQRNYKIWNNDNIIKWLYEGCNNATLLTDRDEMPLKPIPPALSRYKRCNPSDYEDRFINTLPADVNPLNPELVGPAVAFDPNRRPIRRQRFQHLQQQQQNGGALDEVALQQMMMAAAERGEVGFGPDQVILDPDMPMAVPQRTL